MDKKEALKNLYSTFKKYTTSDMHYCHCGCIDPIDVKRLASKKMKDLEEKDFCSYHGSALYTWGDIEHYKHFLPRILEVYNQLNGRGLIGLYEISVKLDYAKWINWEEKERKAIQDFVMIDWIEFVNKKKSHIGIDDLEYYSFFFDINDLLQSWEILEKGNGLRNFVDFFYYYGTELLNTGIRGRIYDKVFINIIKEERLIEKLEEEFFKVDGKDNEYSNKISIVVQMIEQEKQILEK